MPISELYRDFAFKNLYANFVKINPSDQSHKNENGFAISKQEDIPRSAR